MLRTRKRNLFRYEIEESLVYKKFFMFVNIYIYTYHIDFVLCKYRFANYFSPLE